MNLAKLNMVRSKVRTVNSFASNKLNSDQHKNQPVPQFKHSRAILDEANYSAGSSGSSNHSCASISDTAYLNKSGHKSQVHYVNSHGSIFTLAANQYESSQDGSSNQQVSYVQQNDTSSGSCEGSSLEAAAGNNYLLSQELVGKHVNIEGYNTDKQRKQQEQHRRLQHQVHQQLQRIYGSSQPGRVQSFKSCPVKSYTQTDIHGACNHGLPGIEQSSDQSQKVLINNLTERPYDSINLFNGLADKSPVENLNFESQACSTNDITRRDSDPSGQVDTVYNNRRAQLDELHYATATAAALLNATANAAAVIAASAEQQRQQKNQTDGIYSDIYQDLRRRQGHIESQAAPKLRPQKQLNQLNPKSIGCIESEIPFRAPGSNMVYQPASQPRAQIYDLQHSLQQYQRCEVQKTQSQGPQPQVYQSVNNAMRRAIPPQPPARHMNGQAMITTANQVELIRQHQQRLLSYQRAQLQQMMPRVHTIPPSSLPAVTFMQSGNSKVRASLKTELLSRMLLSNLLATQRATGPPNHTGNSQLAIMDKNRAKQGSLPVNQLIPDTRVAAYDGGPESLIPVATGPGGETRGAIMLRRTREPNGFVERVCQLDLTLFWWSLLLVSFFFVGATVTISRYLY